MLFLNFSQYSRKSTCVGVSFYQKTQIFTNTYFQKHLQTAFAVLRKTFSEFLNSYGDAQSFLAAHCLFLKPLKTSEKVWLSDVFKKSRKRLVP